MEMLGTRVRMTVFRKLSGLLYLTNYSHRGKYYTLRTLCRFDDSGLWSYREAWFRGTGPCRRPASSLSIALKRVLPRPNLTGPCTSIPSRPCCTCTNSNRCIGRSSTGSSCTCPALSVIAKDDERPGGDARIARLLGLDPQTVAWGRRQLLAGGLGCVRKLPCQY